MQIATIFHKKLNFEYTKSKRSHDCGSKDIVYINPNNEIKHTFLIKNSTQQQIQTAHAISQSSNQK